jgi:hypothetical protein
MILASTSCLKHPLIVQLESLTFTPFHLISLLLFIFSVIHTLSADKIHNWARALEVKQRPKRINGIKERSFWVHMLYFFSEVEIIFALWAIPLFIIMTLFYGWDISLEYFDTRNYAEALFVVIILAMASTKPIIYAAETLMSYLSRGLGGSIAHYWFVLLTIGPLLGSFITEAAAMALSATLLSRQFYEYHPSKKLAYATIALLFVNISVGGVLTSFASPAVLILAHCWKWTMADMFFNFGWKAIVGIFLSNIIYWFYFRKELHEMNVKKNAISILNHFASPKDEPQIPAWITGVHILVMAWIVFVSHYPPVFVSSFLFFIGFHQATRRHQHPIRLARPMLIGLFLAGLVIHGGLQGWWVVAILEDLNPLSVLGVSMALTGFNDNAAISYLATLVPDWGAVFQYAIFTGVIAGGGLTIIANAPNPAGFAILKKHFNGGIHPLYLFLGALFPTLLFYAIFYLFGPL